MYNRNLVMIKYVTIRVIAQQRKGKILSIAAPSLPSPPSILSLVPDTYSPMY
jgi:hypothetical protein